jgi:hypothetical protein
MLRCTRISYLLVAGALLVTQGVAMDPSESGSAWTDGSGEHNPSGPEGVPNSGDHNPSESGSEWTDSGDHKPSGEPGVPTGEPGVPSGDTGSMPCDQEYCYRFCLAYAYCMHPDQLDANCANAPTDCGERCAGCADPTGDPTGDQESPPPANETMSGDHDASGPEGVPNIVVDDPWYDSGDGGDHNPSESGSEWTDSGDHSPSESGSGWTDSGDHNSSESSSGWNSDPNIDSGSSPSSIPGLDGSKYCGTGTEWNGHHCVVTYDSVLQGCHHGVENGTPGWKCGVQKAQACDNTGPAAK